MAFDSCLSPKLIPFAWAAHFGAWSHREAGAFRCCGGASADLGDLLFKGRAIGVSRPGAISYIMPNIVLRLSGLDPGEPELIAGLQ